MRGEAAAGLRKFLGVFWFSGRTANLQGTTRCRLTRSTLSAPSLYLSLPLSLKSLSRCSVSLALAGCGKLCQRALLIFHFACFHFRLPSLPLPLCLPLSAVVIFVVAAQFVFVVNADVICRLSCVPSCSCSYFSSSPSLFLLLPPQPDAG